jgi:hypothetical protein
LEAVGIGWGNCTFYMSALPAETAGVFIKFIDITILTVKTAGHLVT